MMICGLGLEYKIRLTGLRGAVHLSGREGVVRDKVRRTLRILSGGRHDTSSQRHLCQPAHVGDQLRAHVSRGTVTSADHGSDLTVIVDCADVVTRLFVSFGVFTRCLDRK